MDSAAETGPGAVREQRYSGWKGWVWGSSMDSRRHHEAARGASERGLCPTEVRQPGQGVGFPVGHCRVRGLFSKYFRKPK